MIIKIPGLGVPSTSVDIHLSSEDLILLGSYYQPGYREPMKSQKRNSSAAKLDTRLENLQIHKMSEFDEAQDLEQLLQGQTEVQIQMVHALQPGSTMNYITRRPFRRQWKDKKGELNIAIQTWTITNLRLHFCTIFRNVSQAMS